jgi:hypothetical protein
MEKMKQIRRSGNGWTVSRRGLWTEIMRPDEFAHA